MSKEERYVVIAMRAYGHVIGYNEAFARAKSLWESGDDRPKCLAFFEPEYNADYSDRPRRFDPNDPESIERAEQFRHHSDEFVAVYGIKEFYTDISIWMTTPFDESLVPNFNIPFHVLVDDATFTFLKTTILTHPQRFKPKLELRQYWLSAAEKYGFSAEEIKTYGPGKRLATSGPAAQFVGDDIDTELARCHDRMERQQAWAARNMDDDGPVTQEEQDEYNAWYGKGADDDDDVGGNELRNWKMGANEEDGDVEMAD
ncbi:hypothetical protein M7I_2376 [Glarea lozoyensis 74030]|uniref:Uncharacterized protein n=1 Tax=Glarea lozoyensis (strain ATCC 74030 / MF5533) TaxID=1104152 RepID=H0EIL6_GLAL7|nr:hypothetical protein M7I_2376 [Glarea lozoyensis 74030]